MDYKEKYESALERARIWKDKSGMPKDRQGILDDIFPELKESEDDGIRKALIRAFESLNTIKVWNGIERTDILAWLEKQGNQTIFNTPSRETILAIWELGNDWKELTNGVISTEHGTQLDYIQKHWSESEHYLRERRKQKPTSNEQQGKSALEAIHEQKADNANKIEIVPQTKQEWSDEDEGFLRAAIKTCLENYGQYSEIASWLKSLKQRYISLKQRYIWKPSKIQLARLKEECDKYWEPDGLDTLYTLYQDLKKL